jgi:HlyD family secretion protein
MPAFTKRLPWIVLALIVAFGVGAWRYRVAHRAPEVQYKTAPAEQRRIVGKVTASGTLSALVTVQVGTQVSGRVQKLFADFNSSVKKGELVAKIDPQLFEAAVQQAQANYLSAQAGVATAEATALNARKQLERTRALNAQNLASQADLDTAEAALATGNAAVDAAKASVAQAVASLHQAQVNLSYTSIVSPIDGVVISRTVDVGQTVAASLQTPTLFTIAQDLTKMQVDTSVAEGDVGRLQVGMRTYFTVDSFPGQRFFGRIRQIRNAATTVQNVVTYDAVIDVDNPDLKLRPGMTANVTVIYAERSDAIAVSNAALRFRPPPSLAGSAATEEPRHRRGDTNGGPGGEGRAEGQAQGDRPAHGDGASRGEGRHASQGDAAVEARTIWVLRAGSTTPQAVAVHAGLTDGTVTEVVDGDLHPGDPVVVDLVTPDAPPASSGNNASPAMRRMF